MQLQTKLGQNVMLVGSHPSMGCWSLESALPMTWTDGHVWKASIELPADSTDLEYKVCSSSVGRTDGSRLCKTLAIMVLG